MTTSDLKDLPRLTPKQDKAVKHFILNGNKAAAYRHAYSTENQSQRTIWENALKLFNHTGVLLWIDYYQDRMLVKFETDVDGILDRLVQAVLLAFERKWDAQGNRVAHDIKAGVAALTELNRMAGNHAATKTEFGGPGDFDVETVAKSFKTKLLKFDQSQRKKKV